MLQRIARLAIAAPRRIIAVAVLVFIAAAVFGIPVANSLSPGGFQDPHSESARAIQVLTDKFGQSGQQLLILVTAPAGATSEQARKVGTDLVDQLQRSPLVYNVSSPWTAPPQASADLVSTDGKSGLIVVNVKGGENDAQKNAQTLSDQFVHDRDGVTVRAGGPAMQYAQINKQNQEDLLLMEIDRAPAELPGAGLGVRWAAGGGVADGPGRAGRRRLDVGVAARHLHHRRVDLRAQPEHRAGPGPGHRLHAADPQPLPRRVGRGQRPATRR